MNSENISFPLFIAWWNRCQNQSTPRVHFRIAEWLSERWQQEDRQLLLMAFRGCGKSTLVGLLCAWLLKNDPTTRILVVSADDQLAMRMVRNVRRIIERHPATQMLRPDRPDEWAADRFTVKRSVEWRDPSMLAAGLSANITGMRADVIIADDVEVPNTADTEDKREDLRRRLHELSFIQTPTARTLYVGTPHAVDTIYQTSSPHGPAFLAGFKDFRVPVVDQDGTYVWPEKFGPERCRDIKDQVGEALFQSQMLLIPTAVTACILDPEKIELYDDDIIRQKEWRTVQIMGQDIVTLRAWWDPALAEGRGDRSILAIVATDARGVAYIHRVAEIRADDQDVNDNAHQQCLQVAQLLREFQVETIGVETNGLGRLLPSMLRRVLGVHYPVARVIENNQRRPKGERIRSAFETRLAAARLKAHRSVTNSPFFGELRDWRPGRTAGHDDAIDAVAGAILMDPVRSNVF